MIAEIFSGKRTPSHLSKLGLGWLLLAGLPVFGQARAGQGTLSAAASVTNLTDPTLTAARDDFDHGRWQAAEGKLRPYVGAHARSPEALFLLGATLFRENRPKESLATYTEGAKFARPSAVDFRYVALDYVLLGDYGDADKWMARSVQDDPKEGESWYALGRIEQTENRFADAVAAFRKALERMPQSVKVENNLGLAYEGLNEPEQAMAAYRQAIAWQANRPDPSEQPFLNLGILLTDRGQVEEALGMLKRAESLAPKDSKIHESMGKLYARGGDLPGAQAEFEQAVAAKPDEAGLHFQLGQVYRREGMAERATEELKRAAALEAQTRR